jgi:hypothetical protein
LKVIGTAGFHKANDHWRQSDWIASQSWGSSHEGSESNKQFGGDAQSCGDGSNGDKRRKVTCEKSQRFTNVTSLGGLKPETMPIGSWIVVSQHNNGSALHLRSSEQRYAHTAHDDLAWWGF